MLGFVTHLLFENSIAKQESSEKSALIRVHPRRKAFAVAFAEY